MPREKKLYDENGKEVPTFRQLGITPEIENEHLMQGEQHFERWFLAKKTAWQAANELKKHQNLSKKAEKERLLSLNHWYNALPKSEIRKLILSASDKKDQVFEIFLLKIKINSPLYRYYLQLIERVEESRLELPLIPYSKLKRFPKYSRELNKLRGSSHSFIAMFTSCFPPIDKNRDLEL